MGIHLGLAIVLALVLADEFYIKIELREGGKLRYQIEIASNQRGESNNLRPFGVQIFMPQSRHSSLAQAKSLK